MTSKPSAVRGDHARVERAGAEVVHHHDRADRYVAAEHLGEVGCRGDRLGDQPSSGQPGPGGGVGEQAAAGRAPGRGAGQGDVGGRWADRAAPLLGDPLEYGGDQVRHRNLPVAPAGSCRRRRGVSGSVRSAPGPGERCRGRRGRRRAGRPAPRNTAEGSSGEPSMRIGRARPSGQRATATVFDVPKSTPRAWRFGPPWSMDMGRV